MTDAQLGWLVALCAKGVVAAMLDCTKVLLSEGQDREAMVRVINVLNDISEIEDRMESARRREREENDSQPASAE